MNQYAGKPRAAVMALAAVAALAGCAATKGGTAPALPLYRCEQGLQFMVSFDNGMAVLRGARGDDVLLRDAGGQGAQTVYSNPRLRAEFGLGEGGREALLQYLQPPLMARCLRD